MILEIDALFINNIHNANSNHLISILRVKLVVHKCDDGKLY
jgi:hypothetical protein